MLTAEDAIAAAARARSRSPHGSHRSGGAAAAEKRAQRAKLAASRLASVPHPTASDDRRKKSPVVTARPRPSLPPQINHQPHS